MLWDANKWPCLESCAAFSYTAVRQPTEELPSSTSSSFLFLLLAAAWVRVETLEQCRVAWLRGHTCGDPQLWRIGERALSWAVLCGDTNVRHARFFQSLGTIGARSSYRLILLQICIVVTIVKQDHFLISWRFAGFNWRRISNFLNANWKGEPPQISRSAACNCNIVWSELIYVWWCNDYVCMNHLIVYIRKFIAICDGISGTYKIPTRLWVWW